MLKASIECVHVFMFFLKQPLSKLVCMAIKQVSQNSLPYLPRKSSDYVKLWSAAPILLRQNLLIFVVNTATVFQKMDVRVYVSDENDAARDNHINNFDCFLDVTPHDIATGARSAEWSSPL